MDQIQNEADAEQPNNPVTNSEAKNTTSKDIHDVEVLKFEHEPICSSQKETDVINNDKSNTSEVVSVLEDDDNVLNDTENNLQPAHSSNNTNMIPAQDEVKIADLCSVVTNVLNELTVENLERLLKQIKALSINNEKRLQGVVNLIFEKAVDEPNFSVVGALMCKGLALLHVPATANNKSNTNQEQLYVSFRTLLVKHCQIEFEKNSANENKRNLKLKEIDECTDPEKKKELQMLLEEDDKRMRMKSVGVVRFIGELFQQQMLTVRAMLNFINILLENNNRNEDNLECLCTLLTTVAEHPRLSKNQNLQPYFDKIQQIIDTDHGNISSRVRFKLQNVIELYKIFTNELNELTTDIQDEIRGATYENLVQIKSDNNVKTNSSENSDTQVIDKTVIRYKNDKWSPLNTDGKKYYDRDLLITLQNNPKCRTKPENLPDLDIKTISPPENNDTQMIYTDRTIIRYKKDQWSPLNTDGKRCYNLDLLITLQSNPICKKKPDNLPDIEVMLKDKNTTPVMLSSTEDVKLRETENAWRPARLSNVATLTDDEVKTAELYKKVRGVLNKLSPEKFERLLNQVQALSIDNEERLQGVIDLIFETSVNEHEPNFSAVYALMCKELALMQVPANNKSNKKDTQFVNFRKLLITRCQIEFEKNSADENARNIKIKEIEECTDPEKKKELQLLLEDDDRRMRIKSVGNIRFIGELFKQQMLTVKIMLRCINILLENKDEDSLECLCKLLTIVGRDLELAKNQNLQPYFLIMQEIVNKKHGKISNRVRFMLQDVIDLRNSKWVPRRQDLNPKTMQQIQKEADTEQLNSQVMNSGPMSTPRKDDRMGNQGGSKRRNNQTDDGGWSMSGGRNRTTYTVESSKLMNKPLPMVEITLGSKNLFGSWGRCSNMKTQQPQAALENITRDPVKGRSFESRLNKDPWDSSEGHSMDRSGYNKNYEDGRGSCSGSQHRNPFKKPALAAPVSVPAAPPKQQLNPVQLKLRMQNIMEEYLNDCCTLEECVSDIKASIEQSKLVEFVIEGYNGVLERSAITRHKTGKLFAYLTKNQTLSNEDLYKALKEVLSQADDLVIDIPKLWDYLAEMIVPLVAYDVVTLDKLQSCSDVLVAQGHAHKLFAAILKQLIFKNGT